VFDYFWSRVTQPIPDGVGFALFDEAHLAALALIVAAIVVAPTLLYRKLDDSGRHRMRLIVGCLAMGSDVMVQLVYLITGDYTPERLPLHLCSLGQYCIFIDCLSGSNRGTTSGKLTQRITGGGYVERPLLREIMYSLTIWSTLCAATFPDWAGRPIINIFSWQSFGIHGLLALYPVMIIAAGEFRPNWHRLWQVGVVLIGWMTLCLVVNNVFNTNFMFLSDGAPGSPLEPIQTFAGSYYIPLLWLLLALLWTVLYTPWILADRRHVKASVLSLPTPVASL
jgi:uncharacterized membrane protein YwaF